jgi:hypothetical protein
MRRYQLHSGQCKAQVWGPKQGAAARSRRRARSWRGRRPHPAPPPQLPPPRLTGDHVVLAARVARSCREAGVRSGQCGSAGAPAESARAEARGTRPPPRPAAGAALQKPAQLRAGLAPGLLRTAVALEHVLAERQVSGHRGAAEQGARGHDRRGGGAHHAGGHGRCVLGLGAHGDGAGAGRLRQGGRGRAGVEGGVQCWGPGGGSRRARAGGGNAPPRAPSAPRGPQNRLNARSWRIRRRDLPPPAPGRARRACWP